MRHWQWLARAMTFAGAILLIAWLADAIWAQSGPGYARSPRDTCPVRSDGFGHYQTKWRQWPRQLREEQDNPAAVGKEPLPPPTGRPEPKLPKAVVPQPPVREEILPPPDETILAPQRSPKTGAGLTPPSGDTRLPSLPSGPEKPLLPLLEGNPPATPPADLKKPLTPAPGDVTKPDAAKKSETKTEAKPEPGKNLKPADTRKSDATMPIPTAKYPDPSFGSRWPAAKQSNGLPTAAVASLAPRSAKQDTVVPLTSAIEPERNAPLTVAHRAETIAVTAGKSAGSVEPAAYAVAESSAPSQVELPAVPAVALNGFCPVELTRNGRWVAGNLQWTVVYEGKIYRLSGAEQRQQFQNNPTEFAPVQSGNDVVLSVRDHQVVPGKAAYCATYNGRLYMFSSAESQAEFNRNPQRFAETK